MLRNRSRRGSRTVSSLTIVLCTGLLILYGCTPSGSGSTAGSGGTAAGAGRANDGPAAGSNSGAPNAAARPVSSGAVVALAKVEVRTRSVLVGGRLQPKTRVQHTVPVNGIVRRVAVSPGTRVAEGAELFTVQRNDVGQTYLPAPVTARVAGVVSQVDVIANREVRVGDAGVTVVGSNGYILEAAISDRDAFSVTVGQEITARSPEDSLLSGRLTVRTPEPDYATGLFTLTFEFPDTEGSYIGEFLLIEVPTESVSGLFVPRDAVVRRYGRYYMWSVDSGNRLQRREVTLGETVNDEIRIESGITAGERYVARPTGREREGAAVAGGA